MSEHLSEDPRLHHKRCNCRRCIAYREGSKVGRKIGHAIGKVVAEAIPKAPTKCLRCGAGREWLA